MPLEFDNSYSLESTVCVCVESSIYIYVIHARCSWTNYMAKCLPEVRFWKLVWNSHGRWSLVVVGFMLISQVVYSLFIQNSYDTECIWSDRCATHRQQPNEKWIQTFSTTILQLQAVFNSTLFQIMVCFRFLAWAEESCPIFVS